VNQQREVAQTVRNLMQPNSERSHPAHTSVHSERRRNAGSVDEAVHHATQQQSRRLGSVVMVVMAERMVVLQRSLLHWLGTKAREHLKPALERIQSEHRQHEC